MKKDELAQLDDAVKKLRIAYEKYFAGIERIEPIKERERVKGIMRRIKALPNTNTAHNFRLQQIQASLVTHESYWNRICRQIEEGTYKRDRIKVQRQAEERRKKEAEERREAQQEAAAPATSSSPKAAPASATATAKPAAARRPAAKPATADAGLEKLHRAYVEAQKSVGASKTVGINSLAKTIAKQTAVIKERYKCKDVEFKVAVKNGKAILKAVPRQ